MNKKQEYINKVVWIIGASSGIGEALAYELASRGAVLALSARNEASLKAITDKLNSNEHKIFSFDVSNAEQFKRNAHAIRANLGRIDSIIYLSAVYFPQSLKALDLYQTKEMIDINLLGAFHCIQSVLPIFIEQQTGQIALCGSVAGYIGLPNGQPYSATKAAIQNLAESLYLEHSDMLDIKLISPGFVKTPMTAKNQFKMPMMIEVDVAAKHIANGLLKNNFEIHFPKRFTYILKFINCLPNWMKLKLMKTI